MCRPQRAKDKINLQHKPTEICSISHLFVFQGQIYTKGSVDINAKDKTAKNILCLSVVD